MVDARDIEKVREIDRGIESSQRFEEVLSSGAFSPEEQNELLGAPDDRFIQILKDKGFGDTTGLTQARNDYFLYKHEEPLSLPEEVSAAAEETKGINPMEAAGVLLGLGLTPLLRTRLTPEMFEAGSREYAERAASEWNKTKDYSQAKSYFDAFSRAQQDYFDRFTYSDPKAAKKLANFRTQKQIEKALLRNKLLKKEGIKGFVPRTQATNYGELAENRLKMIDKLSELRAKSGTTTRDLEREKLLRAFADDDPVTFQHHINKQREEGKTLDPLMAKVIAEKIRDEQKTAGRLAASQRRQDQKTDKAPEPAKKPGRIARIRGRLGRLNNLRPSKIASSAVKKVGKSILNLLTKLLKRALIGGVIGAITHLISGLISLAVAIGGVIATILAFVAAKILAGLTAVIVGLLSISLGTVATVLGVITLVGLSTIIIIVIWNSLFPSSSTSLYQGISYTITGPQKVENGEYIRNRIGFFYFSNAICPLENITLIDSLPPESNFVSSTGNYTTTPDLEESIQWKISQNSPTLEDPQVKQYVFDVVHKPADDIIATSTIYIEGCGEEVVLTEPSPGEDDLLIGMDDPPSGKDCAGEGEYEYADIMFDLRGDFGRSAVNFGDPRCEFRTNKLKQLIEKTETASHVSQEGYGDFWMDIAQCESSGNGPNGYSRKGGKDRKTGLFRGKWGLFQMRRSYPNPFKQNEDSLSQNDRGDVTWQRQVQNAISYNNSVLNGSFEYWGTARCLCYYDKYKNGPYCSRLWAKQRACPPGSGCDYIRTPSQCNNNCVANKGR